LCYNKYLVEILISEIALERGKREMEAILKTKMI
jgi:hypothetical protein